jgi:HIT domain
MIAQDSLTFTVRDTLPVSPGHTLILPKRHIASIFEATKEEVAALWETLRQARNGLLKEFSPDGFNIGINDGLASARPFCTCTFTSSPGTRATCRIHAEAFGGYSRTRQNTGKIEITFQIDSVNGEARITL